MKKENMDKKFQMAAHEAQAKLLEAAALETNDVMARYGTGPGGLTEEQAEASRDRYGANKVTREKKKSLATRLIQAFVNPFTVILFVLAGVSTVTDIILPLRTGNMEDFNPVTVCIILTLLLVSGVLRFVQETRSGDAAEKLLELITTTCTVIRDGGKKQDIPLQDVTVGDLVWLSTGDMVPADLRILEAKDLFVSQASLTGESAPQEKVPYKVDASGDKAVTELSNLAFMGTNVISGSATGLVLGIGDHTLFGKMASSMAQGSSGNQLHQRGELGILGTDPVHDGHGAPGIFHQRIYQRRLGVRLPVRHFCGGGADAGNAPHDRHHLPGQRGRFHVGKEDGGKEPELHPEFRGHGRAVHG